MGRIDDRTGLEVLTRDECLALLACSDVGRLAVVDGGRPLIFPVNYALDSEECVVLRTDVGTKLESATRGSLVSFEADAIETGMRTGWSVVVTGVAEEITDTVDGEEPGRPSLRVWAPGAKSRWVRILPLAISGRRIVVRPD